MSYLQRWLEAVHKDLSLGEVDSSVKAVALKWGFTHMGRFSAQYRKRFGELPSHTLQKVGADSFASQFFGNAAKPSADTDALEA